MNVSSHNNRSRHHRSNPQHRHRLSYSNHSKSCSNNDGTSAVLSGVVACLSGLDFDHKEELHEIITRLGGNYSGALDAGCGITHLILDEPEGSVKYRFVQQILADDERDNDDMMKKWAKELKIVTTGWVEACAREGRRVDEGKFALLSSQQPQQWQHHDNAHLSRSNGGTNCCLDDNISNHDNKQETSSKLLRLPTEIPNNATLEEACEWFIQQQQQNDPYGLQLKQIFSMHSFLLVGFHSTGNNIGSKANEGGDKTNNNDNNHRKHRRLHAKLSTLIRNAGGTIYWEPNELTTIVLLNDDVDKIDYDDYNQQQLHHRHQERSLIFQEAKAYCQYHPRGPVAVTPRWILACIHHGSILDFPSSFPSPPPIPIPMLPVPSKRKSSAVVDFIVDDVHKNGKDVKPTLLEDKPKRKHKQSTVFQGDIFVVMRPQQLPSSSSSSPSLEYTLDEMESTITNAGGLILSKRILEAIKKDVVKKQQEQVIQRRKRKNYEDNDIATTDNSDEKRRYYVVSSGGYSNLHHSKYHPLLGELSQLLQQSSHLGSDNSDLSSIIEPVSPIWITACIQEGYLYNPTQYPKLFQPQTYHLRLFPKDTKFLVSVTGFVDASRYGIIWMLRSLGAEYTDSLKAKNTHLICCSKFNDENNNHNVVGGGAKYAKAKEWGLHVVTLDWLYHCMRYGYEEGCEDKFFATTLEDQPADKIEREAKKSSDVIVRCTMDTANITNEAVLTDPVVSTMKSPSNRDDDSSSPRRGKRDRKPPQASPVENDSNKRFKSALQTLQSTPTLDTTTSASRRRRGKRDRSPRSNSSQGSHGGSPSLLSQQSREPESQQAETQFTIRADADIGKHWAGSSGLDDDDEAPLSQVNKGLHCE